MCNTIYDFDTVANGRIKWYPLETILEVWLNQIRRGLFVALSEDEHKKLHPGNTAYEMPWLMAAYSDTVLEETIETFDKLVQAIEEHMPEDPVSLSASRQSGLVDEDDLHLFKIQFGFAYEFLRRAQRPRFRMIAPGLEVQGSSTFTKQPFWSHLVAVAYELPPILLFRFIDTSGEGLIAPIGGDHAFYYPFNQTTEYAAGFYVNLGDTPEDMCKMVLPFGIGENGYARKSDGSRFGGNQENEEADARDVHVQIYSPGHDPFRLLFWHSRLRVLKNWLGIVE